MPRSQADFPTDVAEAEADAEEVQSNQADAEEVQSNPTKSARIVNPDLVPPGKTFQGKRKF